MSIYKSRVNIPLPFAIVGFAVLFIGLFCLASFKLTDKTFTGKEGLLWTFAVGAVPGLVVALAQFALSWVEFAEIGRIRRLGITNVLRTRDNAVYYGKYIEQAKKRIVFVGGTGRRFFQDFADAGSPHPEKRRLIQALERGVSVSIFVASPDYLTAKQSDGLNAARARCDELKKQFPRSFEARMFDHAATYALVQVDEDVIVGPVFPNMESKDTPVIHLQIGNVMAQSYLNFFENEWSTAKPFTNT